MGNPFGNRFRGHLIMTSTGREDDGGHKKIKTKTADGCRCLKKRVGGWETTYKDIYATQNNTYIRLSWN